MNFETVCILGLGYIGLPTASTLATHGLRVIGVDVNPHVVATLRNGGLHLHEPGLRTLVRAALQSGNLTVSETPAEADAFIIAVPTPFKKTTDDGRWTTDDGRRTTDDGRRTTDDGRRTMDDGRRTTDDGGRTTDDGRSYPAADLSYVIAAAEAIVPHLRRGNLVILEATSPPRTTVDVVAPILERSGLKAGADFHLAYSPERVLPGQILRELIENARVIGGIDRPSAEAGRDLYAAFVRGEIYLTDATTAEMVKLMENTYRDVNIAIANTFARLSERFGVDVWEAVALANRHPRVEILRPGPGVGGHCISVDPWFLVEAAPDLAQLIATARQVNDTQPRFVMELTRRALGGLRGRRIAALGLAYKPDVDDLRESPAIEVCRLLQAEGALVKAYEPYKPDAAIEGLTLVPDVDAALEEADVILLLVGHRPFKELHPSDVAARTPARLVVDTVNLWPDPAPWEAAGFRLYRLGAGR